MNVIQILEGYSSLGKSIVNSHYANLNRIVFYFRNKSKFELKCYIVLMLDINLKILKHNLKR